MNLARTYPKWKILAIKIARIMQDYLMFSAQNGKGTLHCVCSKRRATIHGHGINEMLSGGIFQCHHL